MQATPELAYTFPLVPPQWEIGTQLNLARLDPALRKHLEEKVLDEVIRKHRETLIGSRRTRLGAKPDFPRIKALLKEGVLRKLAVMTSPDKVFIAGVSPESGNEDWATELSFLEHLPASERSTYSYYLMFIKQLKGREYVYTYPRPLLRDAEVQVCAIEP